MKRKPNGFSKEERLYLNREVEALFASRKSFSAFPYRIVIDIAEDESEGAKILVSIPKKRLRHATDRNTMKRRTREAYRTMKHPLLETIVGKGIVVRIGFLYLANELTPSQKVRGAVGFALSKIRKIVEEV